MLQPFTRKDLMIRSLPDRIHDCHQMINLYPNMPKDTAFGKYYSSPPETVGRGRGSLSCMSENISPNCAFEGFFAQNIFVEFVTFREVSNWSELSAMFWEDCDYNYNLGTNEVEHKGNSRGGNLTFNWEYHERLITKPSELELY